MKSPYEIIKVPLLTEKSTIMNQKNNKASFNVACNANKKEIAKSVEEIFNCHITKVNIINVQGKKKRLGKYLGRRSNWKKAICTVAEGDKIDIIEGM
ncbi:50S ribosomal protein L23 [bacterium]|nr:50S ribosomal protein L23 [bacterium]